MILEKDTVEQYISDYCLALVVEKIDVLRLSLQQALALRHLLKGFYLHGMFVCETMRNAGYDTNGVLSFKDTLADSFSKAQ